MGSRKLASEMRSKEARAEFFSADFFRTICEQVFGKSVDGAEAKVLVGNLSLTGKLFEIYFVRLIGTPNQQFKNDPDTSSGSH